MLHSEASVALIGLQQSLVGITKVIRDKPERGRQGEIRWES